MTRMMNRGAKTFKKTFATMSHAYRAIGAIEYICRGMRLAKEAQSFKGENSSVFTGNSTCWEQQWVTLWRRR